MWQKTGNKVDSKKRSTNKLHPGNISLRVVFIYAVISILWLLYSDRLAAIGISDPGSLAAVQTVKEYGFVAATSVILFLLIYKALHAGTVWNEKFAESFRQFENAHHELSAAEERIFHLAYYDSLTELPNRALFDDRLTIAMAQARRNGTKVAVLYLDLDNFKAVNDTLGHDFGDRLLKSVGEMLDRALREMDTVARLGGDEFAVMLPGIHEANDILGIVDRIVHSFQQAWILNEREFFITTSIGITIYPDDGTDGLALCKNADTAMYCAKEQGKNCYYFYSPDMNARMLEKVDTENNLRYALKRDEFSLYYQPLVDIRTGKVEGVEALLRWIRPSGEIVPPARFISPAEETGLIVPIGEWVLKAACRQNKLWQQTGYPPVRVSVNLSARQFQQRSLVQTIIAILEETELDPQWLELEITESTAMKDMDFTVEVLHKLKAAGIKVSLDDFGTGYSSLNYLKKLPIDTLKIDKTFVHDITEKTSEEAIAKAVISLAHSMKLHVTAEGVETQQQLEFLRSQKCDKAQGYLYSRPLPAEEAEAVVREGRIVVG